VSFAALTLCISSQRVFKCIQRFIQPKAGTVFLYFHLSFSHIMQGLYLNVVLSSGSNAANERESNKRRTLYLSRM
jgi:hypothetical protein